jgi:hypothetical protein
VSLVIVKMTVTDDWCIDSLSEHGDRSDDSEDDMPLQTRINRATVSLLGARGSIVG